MKQFTAEEKENLLNKYKELYQSEKVHSINEFIKRQEELLDLDYELKYPTFYKWTKKREDIKNLKGKPVQQTKNHKPYEDREEKEIEKEEDLNGNKEEEELELEKRIENVDRIETENPESKHNQKKSEEITEEVKETFNYNKLYIAGGIIAFGSLAVFLLSRSKKKKEKEVMLADVKRRNAEEQAERQRQQQGGWSSKFSTPADY